jgi:hypothetical protein
MLSLILPYRLAPALALLTLVLGRTAAAQTSLAPLPAPPTLPASFYTTYNYTSYTVHDNTSAEPPTVVQGVGGTLMLRPAGTYEKRLSIVGRNGPMYFKQDGRFRISGDTIRFAFSDLKGADVQQGTFRFDPQTQQLVITIYGYPTGNKGVYELVSQARTPGRQPDK